MAYRYWKPWVRKNHTVNPNRSIPNNKIANTKSGNRLRQLLEELTAREDKDRYDVDPKKFAYDKYYRFTKWGKKIWNKKPPKHPKFRPCLADDYQKFKKNFVDEYDGEIVQETGMTNKEFWEWFTNGKREGIEMHSEEYWNSIPEDQWIWEC
jgi:hypothetical protein